MSNQKKLKITETTYAKASTAQASDLTDQQKVKLFSGKCLPLSEIKSDGNHWKVSFFVYKGHSEVIEQTPSQLSENGLNLLKRLEGLRLESYQDSAGVWTIGYGHTLFVEEGLQITEGEAEDLLRQDLRRFEEAVSDRVTVALSQNHFDALVIFAFNVGNNAFADSTLLRKLNDGDFAGASEEFGRWVFAGEKRLEGLANRRKKEKELFMIGYS